MAARKKKIAAPPLPAAMAAGAFERRAAVEQLATHTCELPAPSAWPPDLKRLVVGTLTRNGMTWDGWCRPFSSSDTAAWVGMRSAARQILCSHKLIDNDTAWTVCHHAAVLARENDRTATTTTTADDGDKAA